MISDIIGLILNCIILASSIAMIIVFRKIVDMIPKPGDDACTNSKKPDTLCVRLPDGIKGRLTRACETRGVTVDSVFEDAAVRFVREANDGPASTKSSSD